MGFSRRQILAATLAAGSIPGCGGFRSPLFLGSAKDDSGTHHLGAFDRAGDMRFRTPLPGRGHAPAVAPDGEIVVVPARRPGDWMAVIECRAGELLHVIRARRDRHFYGHATFSGDGKRLFTTENDFGKGRGMIVCRSARSLDVIGEFTSGGIGPHQLKWVQGDQLIVANGGIRTHPAEPRRKLNVDSMRPNVTLIDARTGAMVHRAVPRDPKSSIRHFDTARNGDVVLGIQYEGPQTLDRPLVLVLGTRTGDLTALPAPLSVQRQMKQYTASVCVDPRSNHALVTSPRGHLATLWDLGGKGCVATKRMRDVSGVALDAEAGAFVATSGAGTVVRFDTATLELRRSAMRRFPDLHWDNHLTAT